MPIEPITIDLAAADIWGYNTLFHGYVSNRKAHIARKKLVILNPEPLPDVEKRVLASDMWADEDDWDDGR